jgi:hypothetical protein
MNVKLKLLVWTDKNRGFYILVINILPSILAFFNSLKDFRLFNNLVIGDKIETKFFMKHL